MNRITCEDCGKEFSDSHKATFNITDKINRIDDVCFTWRISVVPDKWTSGQLKYDDIDAPSFCQSCWELRLLKLLWERVKYRNEIKLRNDLGF